MYISLLSEEVQILVARLHVPVQEIIVSLFPTSAFALRRGAEIGAGVASTTPRKVAATIEKRIMLFIFRREMMRPNKRIVIVLWRYCFQVKELRELWASGEGMQSVFISYEVVKAIFCPTMQLPDLFFPATTSCSHT